MRLTPDQIRAALLHCDGAFIDHGYIDVSQARPAGVVLPILFTPDTPDTPDAEGPSVVLVLRGAHLKDHPGEIGFPGGKPELEDADLRATALRELDEEIGIGAGDIEWLGRLSPRPVITGRYMIHPFVAAVREGASPRVNSPEIERLLTLPLLPLIRGEMPFYCVAGEWRGERMIAQHFRIGASVLYGASAYIFYELLALVAAELGLPIAKALVEETPPWGDRYPSPRARR